MYVKVINLQLILVSRMYQIYSAWLKYACVQNCTRELITNSSAVGGITFSNAKIFYYCSIYQDAVYTNSINN